LDDQFDVDNGRSVDIEWLHRSFTDEIAGRDVVEPPTNFNNVRDHNISGRYGRRFHRNVTFLNRRVERRAFA
jgi:hypothetical protein